MWKAVRMLYFSFRFLGSPLMLIQQGWRETKILVGVWRSWLTIEKISYSYVEVMKV